MASQYLPGHLKQNPETGASATKQDSGQWGIMPTTGGAYYWPESLVADWPDMVAVVTPVDD